MRIRLAWAASIGTFSSVLLCACAANGPGEAQRSADRAAGDSGAPIFATATGERLDLASFGAQLAEMDVVFLGEIHDSDAAHQRQLQTLEVLGELRPRIVLSLEMFERDTQLALDRWLSGAIDEQEFLAGSRPWPNYQEHYRPLLLLAKQRGWPVLAANVPRPLAARVSRQGLGAVRGASFTPRWVDTSGGEYFERFAEAMGMHGSEQLSSEGLLLWYSAQCLKDDAMAEAIADERYGAGWPRPLVVHLNGRFHSDARLGTVERFLERDPSARVAVISSVSSEEWSQLERDAQGARKLADYVWVMP